MNREFITPFSFKRVSILHMFEAYVLQAFPFTQAKASFHLGKLNPIPKSEKLFFHVFFVPVSFWFVDGSPQNNHHLKHLRDENTYD